MKKCFIRSASVILMASTAILFAGCAGFGKTNTAAPPVTIGIVDVDKAVRSHPKYGQVEMLQREMNTLAAQLGLAQRDSGSTVEPADIATQIDAALNQEYNEKMKSKQAELTNAMSAKAAQLKEQLDAEMQEYGREVDKIYQPDIFNIQLKIKTVQVSKEETAALQKELEDLQNKRTAQLSAKEQELTTRWQAALEAEQAQAGKQMDAYGTQLGNELSQRGAAQSSAVLTAQSQTDNNKRTAATDNETKLGLKRQELTALQSSIVEDIRNNTGKVAVAKGLEVVLVKPLVNGNAIDITEAVIAEGKK